MDTSVLGQTQHMQEHIEQNSIWCRQKGRRGYSYCLSFNA